VTNLIFVLSLFFICALTSLCVNEKKNTNNKIKWYIILSIIIIIGVALRDGNSLNDYKNYVDIYNNSSRAGDVEPSFYIIKQISEPLGGMMAMFAIYAFLCVFIKIVAFYRLTKLLFLTLTVYVANIMILHDMTQIRAGVTSAVFLYSIPFLRDGKHIKYLICVLIATFFHFSGLLLIIPCLYWIKCIRNSFLFLALIIPIGYLLGGTIFDVSNFPIESIRIKLQMYKNLQAAGAAGLKDLNLFNPYIIFRIALYYILLSKSRLIAAHNENFKCLLFIESIALFVFPAFSSIALLGYRGSELIGIVEVVLYPMLFYAIKPRLAGKLSVIGIGALLLGVNLTYKHLIYI